MIDFRNGRIEDLFQNAYRNDPEIRSLGYAILMEKQRIIRAVDMTRTEAAIDVLPESILDVLAVELRSPYYGGDIDQKRRIIKGTLLWYFRAGTPAAVRELIEAVFGYGEITEWFDYEEPPYTPGTFDLETDVRMTQDMVDAFLGIIGRVKNTRSHLRRVKTRREGIQKEYIGAGTISEPFVPVITGGEMPPKTITQPERIGSGALAAPRYRVITGGEIPPKEILHTVTIGAGAIARPRCRVLNLAPERQRDAGGTAYHAAGAISAPRITIRCRQQAEG